MGEKRQKVQRGYDRNQEKAELQAVLEEFYAPDVPAGAGGSDDPGLAALMSELEGGPAEPAPRSEPSPEPAGKVSPRDPTYGTPRDAADEAVPAPRREQTADETHREETTAAQPRPRPRASSAPPVPGPTPSGLIEWLKRLWARLLG